MDVRYEVFKKEHLSQLEPQETQAEFISTMTSGLMDYPMYLESVGLIETLMLDGVVVAIGGVVPLNKGSAEGFVVLSETAKKHPRTLVSWMRTYLNAVQFVHGFHRIQTLVVEDFERGHRFIGKLGFKAEGTLEAYGEDRTNFVMYGRVI